LNGLADGADLSRTREAFKSDFSVTRIDNTYIIGFQGVTRELDGGSGVSKINVNGDASFVNSGGAVIETRMDGINYYGFEEVNILFGSGTDVLNVQGTSTGSFKGINDALNDFHAATNISLADGNDRVYISSNADLDHNTIVSDYAVNEGDVFEFLTGHLDDIDGNLNIDVGSGRHRMLISDEAASQGDDNVSISDTIGTPTGDDNFDNTAAAEIQIKGLAFGDITYGAAGDSNSNFYDGIIYWTGSGNDTIDIDGTHYRSGTERTITMLNTGLGDDDVTVDLGLGEDGFFALHTMGGADTETPVASNITISDDDTVDASASSLPLVIFGGLGSDNIIAGQARDIVIGDFGRVQYLQGSNELDTVLGFGGRGDKISSLILEPDHVFTTDVNLGGNDSLSGKQDGDLLIGGTGKDWIYGDDATASSNADDLADILIGDQVNIFLNEDATSEDVLLTFTNLAKNIRTTDRTNSTAGDDDVLIGAHGDDILVGAAGNDIIDGGDSIKALTDGADNDDLIFGDHVELGRRDDGVVTDSRFQNLLGQMLYARNDLPAYLQGLPATNSGMMPDLPDFSGDEAGFVLVDGTAQDYRTVGVDGNSLDLPIWAEWLILDLDHSETIKTAPGASNRFGDDYIAGGNANDMIFAQLGDDIVQGDGSIETAIDAVNAATDSVNAARDILVASQLTPSLTVPAYQMTLTASYEQADDGDDYIEGNGGNDVIFGNLGQDDIVGDNSGLYTLDSDDERKPTGNDIIFGGSGERAEHDHDVREDNKGDIVLKDVHARDADTIAGDNANIYRIVGSADVTYGNSIYSGTPDTGGFLSFDYDSSRIDGDGASLNNQLIIVRAVELLDYTQGGPDYLASALNDFGGADEIHGESGDDFIYGMRDADVLFGDSEDDDIIGGWGPDWISGGRDMDGVIGDDGRIYSSRYVEIQLSGNETEADKSDYSHYSEILNGVLGIDEFNKEIRTPGNIQQAIIHPTLVLNDFTVTEVGEIFKTVDLTPFHLSPVGEIDDPLFTPMYANDIIFGGLGNDFLHGSAGDDGISGAEALPVYFNAPVNPDDPTHTVIDPERTLDHSQRPDDLLGFLPGRIEFYDYDEEDPRSILGDVADGYGFLLNFDPAGDPNPGELQNDNFDEDQIFGDLGNDWIVGGPDNDQMFGGFGADLMDADDDKTTNGDGVDGDNYGPDPINIDIQDRAYGGAGRDVLIANTGGDRLMDWIGEFNSFLTPFAPFGEFTVTRAVSPHIFDFLYDLSEALGADPTRSIDSGNFHFDRNGEPDGELGLPVQKDGQLWKDQTGAPIDPQPGNIPGGKRLTLRGVDFNDGTQQAFTADSGQWAVRQGRFEVSPEVKGEDATAVFHVGEYIPKYYEVKATISTAKPTGGMKANAYLVFDYVSPTDYKFGGFNVSTDKLEMGYVDESGWHVVAQSPAKLKPNTDYEVLIAVNGLTVTVVVDNLDKSTMTHVFAARVDDDGYSYGLNYGLVGLAAQNATARIDNLVVQVLKPEITFEDSNDFSDNVNGFTPVAGDWSHTNGALVGVSTTSRDALSAYDLSVSPNASLEMFTKLSTDNFGGFYFDHYGEQDYKFAGVLSETNQVVIGHWSAKHGNLVYDVVSDIGFNANGQYDLNVNLKGSVVTVSLGIEDQRGDMIYHDILAHVFNAVVVDGGFGLLSMDGVTSFDSFAVQTDDDAFLEPSAALLAEMAGQGDGYVLQLDDIADISTAAKQKLISGLRLSEEEQAVLDNLSINVADLSGSMLARSNGTSIEFDFNAAGHGWFVDRTPEHNEEFRYSDDKAILQTKQNTQADGRVDLLTALSHEMGHVLGYEHGDFRLMDETLATGTRVDFIGTDVYGQVIAEKAGEKVNNHAYPHNQVGQLAAALKRDNRNTHAEDATSHSLQYWEGVGYFDEQIGQVKAFGTSYVPENIFVDNALFISADVDDEEEEEGMKLYEQDDYTMSGTEKVNDFFIDKTEKATDDHSIINRVLGKLKSWRS